MDGWKTIVSFWDGFLAGAIAVSCYFQGFKNHLAKDRESFGKKHARWEIPNLLIFQELEPPKKRQSIDDLNRSPGSVVGTQHVGFNRVCT